MRHLDKNNLIGKNTIHSIGNHFELFDGDMMLYEDEIVLTGEDFQETGPDHVVGL